MCACRVRQEEGEGGCEYAKFNDVVSWEINRQRTQQQKNVNEKARMAMGA